MASNVYDPRQQTYRVEFAIRVILSGASTTRRFDACFEMNDGDQVCARIYKRALRNPRLMEALPRYLVLESCQEQYEKYAKTFGYDYLTPDQANAVCEAIEKNEVTK